MTNGFTEVLLDERSSIDDYKKLEYDIIAQLSELAKDLRGKTIIHINATPRGGGVAEMLISQVPLERELGLNSRWFSINAPEEFFAITKKIHNLFQGQPGSLTEEEKDFYLRTNEELAKSFMSIGGLDGGIAVIHDPQPMAMVPFIASRFSPVLRIHIDLSTPNPEIVDFFKPYLGQFDKIIVSNKDYRNAFPWLDDSKFIYITPSIDPFSEKNRHIEIDEARKIVAGAEINTDKPLITQVSRFDPWKDPIGAINAYYLAKNQIPDLQLVLAGSHADDDPEGKEVFKKVEKHAEGDPDIFLLVHPEQFNGTSPATFINALQTCSDVVLQMSTREGFGLVITEAMWKTRPVVARAATGAKMQIEDGVSGFLISSNLQAAGMIIELIKNPLERQKIGQAARRSVLNHFLIPKMIMDHLDAYRMELKTALRQ